MSCSPERSEGEGSGSLGGEMLRFAQHDKAVPACHTLVGVPSRSPLQEQSAMSLKLTPMGATLAVAILLSALARQEHHLALYLPVHHVAQSLPGLV